MWFTVQTGSGEKKGWSLAKGAESRKGGVAYSSRSFAIMSRTIVDSTGASVKIVPTKAREPHVACWST